MCIYDRKISFKFNDKWLHLHRWTRLINMLVIFVFRKKRQQIILEMGSKNLDFWKYEVATKFWASSQQAQRGRCGKRSH